NLSLVVQSSPTADSTAPEVTAWVGTPTTDTTPRVHVQATDDLDGLADAAFSIDVDLNNDGDYLDASEANYASGNLDDGSGTADLPSLSVGTYRLRARVSDASGNQGTSSSVTLVVQSAPSGDVTAPAVSVWAPSPTTDTTPRVRVKAADDHDDLGGAAFAI